MMFPSEVGVDGGVRGGVDEEASTSNCREMNESEFIVVLGTVTTENTTPPATVRRSRKARMRVL